MVADRPKGAVRCRYVPNQDSRRGGRDRQPIPLCRAAVPGLCRHRRNAGLHRPGGGVGARPGGGRSALLPAEEGAPLLREQLPLPQALPGAAGLRRIPDARRRDRGGGPCPRLCREKRHGQKHPHPPVAGAVWP